MVDVELPIKTSNETLVIAYGIDGEVPPKDVRIGIENIAKDSVRRSMDNPMETQVRFIETLTESERMKMDGPVLYSIKVIIETPFDGSESKGSMPDEFVETVKTVISGELKQAGFNVSDSVSFIM